MRQFSYNECYKSIFYSQNQWICACDDNTGHGLNANQGRGALEINFLEGSAISSSVQVMLEDLH
ncbi:hypothetical protein PC129_g24338 [Phytophthora cactorum]|nr:hypothetical protein PC114_g25913 [Phytophthora cactorum]KAG2963446.1 hypothetical protein PC119_g25512 [Phytophthora cactorum]KAG3001140.1 hypothetical protein PC120_g20450 [Phytophthora cactorum]KAG3198438.1 hypothetical protein PC129_g24338 [Phytophthora cactorum]KAG4224001.1 hypothetical protein PC116_g27542 [Phytophthora cactorum]